MSEGRRWKAPGMGAAKSSFVGGAAAAVARYSRWLSTAACHLLGLEDSSVGEYRAVRIESNLASFLLVFELSLPGPNLRERSFRGDGLVV